MLVIVWPLFGEELLRRIVHATRPLERARDAHALDEAREIVG